MTQTGFCAGKIPTVFPGKWGASRWLAALLASQPGRCPAWPPLGGLAICPFLTLCGWLNLRRGDAREWFSRRRDRTSNPRERIDRNRHFELESSALVIRLMPVFNARFPEDDTAA
ncbi:hypothetical protein [Sphingosinicella sp. BN140058]|uniref:hypothetical protein n=1 Tax=Sphingosinicella sp. BN140058 TaxID=1892855 RepID=UPI0010117F18|nr:hypothetical protein [Sphingosinicella sp. BN140058]QAY78181.1 hypothetical protein ETR14_17840 [Sphingosinicella sp. BN140058]